MKIIYTTNNVKCKPIYGCCTPMSNELILDAISLDYVVIVIIAMVIIPTMTSSYHDDYEDENGCCVSAIISGWPSLTHDTY